MRYHAIVLAGGRGTRMGGVLKPLLTVAGVPLLTRVLTALEPADHRTVAGPSELDSLLAPGVERVQEDPPGGGPVAGIRAGLGDHQADKVITVAGDLPFLTWEAITLLDAHTASCVLFVDGDGRRQPLVAVWQGSSLRRALYGVPAEGRSMRDLLAAADVAQVRWPGAGPEPWYDCDTPEQLRQAEEML
ncbi:molybdenum cofactor guanylyltransferase [Catelliglobosispora koreensis]|uniref:molybdenum cofactor guanylyltransferase n=1 Tax=Catelliglobosispora koreensis TaxID=129052 RepID=UPI000380C314|nr:molybdenum cofactor guanylyltransferase [Catelliglobosispora koreensis]